MIKNTSEIVSQHTKQMEGILTNLLEKILEQEAEEKLNINVAEKLAGEAIRKAISLILSMIGILLSNIIQKDDCTCEHCKKELPINKKGVKINIMTIYGVIEIIRDTVFCRICHEGRGLNDKFLNIIKRHTKGITELAAYTGQLLPSFEEGCKTIEKYLGFMGVKISETTIRETSESIGNKVFEEGLKKAKEVYKEPEKNMEILTSREKCDGVLNIMMDGSHVNTIEKNEKGSTWREMKLGEVFNNRDIIYTKSGNSIITKKEYVTFFGGVEEFKKVILAAAIRGRYGKYKETNVLGDGAAWIWNLCKEIFPDATQILDFFHLSENVNDYAKFLYPLDEINRTRWVHNILEMFKTGKHEEAIKIVNETDVEKEKVPKGTVYLPEYLEKNASRVNYKEYIDKGYYIGSGPIESGNKTVIQQRMKQAGMRWSIDGGQHIAALRAKYKSDLWDDVISIIESA
jgi:hypothetical protein